MSPSIVPVRPTGESVEAFGVASVRGPAAGVNIRMPEKSNFASDSMLIPLSSPRA